MATTNCSYCFKPRTDMEGWHDCPRAQDMKARVEGQIDAITRMQDLPYGRRLTSDEMKVREDRRHEMANTLLARNRYLPKRDHIKVTREYGQRQFK